MKTNYSGKTIGGYLLAFFLLFGILTVASSSAQAQYPWGNDRDRRDDRYRRDRDWDYRNNRQAGLQTARQQGYSYGINVGAADAQRGQNYNPQRSRYYRNGTGGYNTAYQQVFRQAFLQGYRDGYQRYAYDRRNGRWRW